MCKEEEEVDVHELCSPEDTSAQQPRRVWARHARDKGAGGLLVLRSPSQHRRPGRRLIASGKGSTASADVIADRLLTYYSLVSYIYFCTITARRPRPPDGRASGTATTSSYSSSSSFPPARPAPFPNLRFATSSSAGRAATSPASPGSGPAGTPGPRGAGSGASSSRARRPPGPPRPPSSTTATAPGPRRQEYPSRDYYLYHRVLLQTKQPAPVSRSP